MMMTLPNERNFGPTQNQPDRDHHDEGEARSTPPSRSAASRTG